MCAAPSNAQMAGLKALHGQPDWALAACSSPSANSRAACSYMASSMPAIKWGARCDGENGRSFFCFDHSRYSTQPV
jgi:hypothetical protein